MTLLHQPLILRVALCATMLSLGLLSFSPTKAPAQASGAKLEELLEYANLLFSREQYGVAAGQYRTFIQENSKSPNLQIAWFRLGECYLKVNQIDDAVTSFNFLIENFRTGPFVGSAAYRVAVLRLNAKDYQNALTFFDVARKQLNDSKAKLQAGYYHARCLQLTDQPKEALAAFDRLVKEKPKEDNPLYERGMLEKARLQFELGSPEKALKTFSELAESASTKEVKEEAIVRTGLLAAEAGQTELSEKFLNQALKFSDTSPWKNLAQIGAIFNAFAAEDYDRVIGLYQTGAYSSPEDSRAKMLLIVGHSYRIKGDLDSALRLYALVEGKYPDRTEGSEAGYRRLQILHQKGDRTLPELASRFAEKQRRIEPNSQYIDMSWLMVAEWHFSEAENSASGPGSEFAKKHFGDAADGIQACPPR
jgi:tetratricopeptide (TPR) repeat protein